MLHPARRAGLDGRARACRRRAPARRLPAFAADTATDLQRHAGGHDVRRRAPSWPTRSASRTRRSPTAPSPTRPRASAQVPQKTVGEGKDEAGRPVDVAGARHGRADSRCAPLSDERGAAPRRAAASTLAGAEPRPEGRAERLPHRADDSPTATGNATGKYALDTAVSYNLTLGGLPVTGQGAKLRITFAGDGSVTQLSSSLRKLERGKRACRSSPPTRPHKACAALYDADVRQAAPTLGYLLPACRPRSVRQGHRAADLPGLHVQPGRRQRPAGPPPGAGRAGAAPAGDVRRRAGGRRRQRLRRRRPAAPRPTATSGRPRRRCSTATAATRRSSTSATPRDGTLTGETA